MRRFVVGAMLSCLSAIAVAADPAEIVSKLIGYEYAGVPPGQPVLGFDGCVDEGGGVLHGDKLSFATIRCGKRNFLILNRTTGEKATRPRFHILDAIVLPRFDPYFTSDNNKLLVPNGVCAFDGDYEKDMQVLVRFGKRERITSKNGVLTAWGFDLDKGKIIPLDISRIVCEKPDDP